LAALSIDVNMCMRMNTNMTGITFMQARLPLFWLHLFQLSKDAIAIAGMQKDDRIAVCSDARLCINRLNAGDPAKMLNRLQKVPNLIADMMDPAPGVLVKEGPDGTGLAELLEQLNLYIWKLYKGRIDAVFGLSLHPTGDRTVERRGEEWSGVEWSGVEWSGVEWSGVEWSGVEWRGV
jgi:hypothetical protein